MLMMFWRIGRLVLNESDCTYTSSPEVICDAHRAWLFPKAPVPRYPSALVVCKLFPPYF